MMAEAAIGLAARGHEVEVLTTCALDHYGWANALPEGVTEERGVLVRRFEVAHRPSRAALAAQLSIQAGRVPDLEHQVSWLGFQFACPGLFDHVVRHGGGYDALVFAPYLFWNTTACLPFVADRAVFLPCLHDETYARLDLVRSLLAEPAVVWFLTGPERDLALQLGPVARRHSVVGAGVPVPRRYDPAGFRERHGLARPFVLYAGRREEDKGLAWLLGVMAEAGTGLPGVDLVLIGKGDPAAPLEVPPALAGRVVDLGFVDDAQRNDAFAAALAYVQPSRVESFSRTAMESWLAGTPVLGFAGNPVVAWHCRRSGGGLLFSDARSLAGALRDAACDPGGRARLGEAGRRYVVENYTWPAVLDRMEASLHAWGGAARSGLAAAAGNLSGNPYGRWLVAGSYPPVPGGPAAAALSVVKRGWSEGAEVVVASPRPSAGRYVLASSGRSLGRQLAALRRRERCEALVLCVEPGWPLAFGAGGWRRRRAVRAIVSAARRFGSVEVLVTGTPRDLGAQLDVLAPLWQAADRVTASSPELAAQVSVRAFSPAGAGKEQKVTVVPQPVSEVAVSPLEPGELLLATRARRLAGRLARRLLGRQAPAVRARMEKLLRSRL